MSDDAENDRPIRLEEFNASDCLIYGIGNIGRQDDGLGWAFIDKLEQIRICPKADTTRHYQLHLEDADLISHKRRVLFVDATKAPHVDSFQLTHIAPKIESSFTSHALSIPTILATCHQCFDRYPDVYLLAIRGYHWALKQGLTPRAEKNLRTAINNHISTPIS